MGKRKKSSRGPTKKQKETLPKIFQCLFCNHEDSVTVKIDKKAGVGLLTCKVCGQNFQTATNQISHAVDVYAAWMDACEAVAEGAAADETARVSSHYASGYQGTARPTGGARPAPRREEEMDNDDGFIVDDEPEMEGAFDARLVSDDED